MSKRNYFYGRTLFERKRNRFAVERTKSKLTRMVDWNYTTNLSRDNHVDMPAQSALMNR